MKALNRPLLTVCIIFGSAFLLVVVGCGSSSSPVEPSDNSNVIVQNQTSDSVIPRLTESQIPRECSSSEYKNLVAWSLLLAEANEAIDIVDGKKTNSVIQKAIEAVKSCDYIVAHHTKSPCRKTEKTILSEKTKYYDQSRLLERCKISTDYLVMHNARPPKSAHPVVYPSQPPVNSGGGGSGQPSNILRQCSKEEFAQINDYNSKQQKTDGLLKSFGDSTNWKYDSNILAQSQATTQSCEALIKHHDEKPCQYLVTQTDGKKDNKEFSGRTLRARCESSRMYFYEYAQNTKTLIFPNAQLYLDLSALDPQIFQQGYHNQISGNCIVENKTDKTIDYSNRQALIVDTRGFEEKMFIMETAEGLLIQCYGLNVEGPFSKRQIVRVLREELLDSEKQSDIRLTYKLK